jgi:hypothetical protein
MKILKKLSLISFLSVIVCIISIAVNVSMHSSNYSADVYGWPQPFLKVVFNDNKIVDKNFDFLMLLADYLYSFISVLLLFLFIDLITIRRKSMLANTKEEEAKKLMTASPVVRKFLTEANK